MGPGSFDPGSDTSKPIKPFIWQASMGPGSFDPGSASMTSTPRRFGRASMGPGSFDPGSDRARGWWTSPSNASMGPGSFDPGSYRRPNQRSGGRPASMGPGSFDPGSLKVAVQTPAQGAASMGPGSFDPGSAGKLKEINLPKVTLQWGRGLSTPEVACAVTILFSKSLRRGCERRLARRASSLRTSIAPECNPLQALYIGRRERLCYFPQRSAARAPHRVTNTGYSSNSPSSVFASSRV